MPSRPRGGNSSSTRSAISPAPSGAGAPRGTPISITSTRPAWKAPGATCSPIFEPWKVPVTSARTASPSTSPLEASTPEGTSQATTGASCALIAAMAPATGSRGAPENPVPNSASTTTPEPSSRSGANGSGGAPGSRSSIAAGSPESSSTGATASTSTTRPSSRSSRATTRPSPPLLPLPITTRTGPSPATSAVSRARPSPARSIRSSEGTPCSSIAQASTARISSAA